MEIIQVIWEKNNKGVRPIARLDNGKIVVICNDNKFMVEVGSSWDCNVLKNEERKIIVRPFKLVLTRKQNEEIAGFMAGKLVTPKPKRKQKQKNQFIYRSKFQLNDSDNS